jgi:hypothetical protein
MLPGLAGIVETEGRGANKEELGFAGWFGQGTCFADDGF